MEILKVTLWEDVPSAQSLSIHKKLHNDLTKPCDMCKKAGSQLVGWRGLPCPKIFYYIFYYTFCTLFSAHTDDQDLAAINVFINIVPITTKMLTIDDSA